MIKNIQEQKLAQRFSPLQIQLMNMLAMPTLAFEEYLANEIESNPALEADYSEPDEPNETDETSPDPTDDDSSQDADPANDSSDGDFDLEDYMYEDEAPDYIPSSSHRQDPQAGDRNTFIAAQGTQSSFADHLTEQLLLEPLDETQMVIGRYIIGNLDPDGYLRRSAQEIADDLAFSNAADATAQQVDEVADLIRTFDPPGVGAATLQQCLSLQLDQLPDTPPIVLARRIVADYFPLLAKKNFDALLEKTGGSRDELARAIEEIGRLNPKPGGAYLQGAEVSSSGVTPDFVVRIEDGRMEVSLSESDHLPTLHVSRQYADMMHELGKLNTPSKTQQETAAFVRSKIDAARWFIDAVHQRRATLLRIMRAIAHRQRRYLLSGDVADMVPLGLKDIAADVSMDISTVSRVASQKYADTPYGVIRLKDFFSEGAVNRQGEDISTREVKQNLSGLIEGEDKNAPYTDEQLTALLGEKGYNIARRTVAKYREALGYPTARLRRRL